MTATLFNASLQPQAAPVATAEPAPLRSVAVVGGGTAGWMTALTLARGLAGRGVEITLVESPSVPTIGVGEGSTPWLRGFFDALGIEEAEWMPACHATYKCGITFSGWSTRPGFESYFHPFASMLDNLTMGAFVHNAEARVNGADVHAHPNRFFIAALLAAERRAPKPRPEFPFDIWHGYHFDATLLGTFLRQKAIERGVRHLSAHVRGATLDAGGAIASLALKDRDPLAAEFFIDCTGFAGLLITEALKTPFVGFQGNLFNDAAVAMPSPIDEEIPSETVSTALRHGWAWRIPLTSRYGNGYVFSTQACTADAAETELRTHLGLLDAEVPVRHLRMRIGRVTRHWNANCLAVGLSGGFIEPLEATALLFIQRTAEWFVDSVARGEIDEPARDRFNQRVNAHFEGTRDYIVTHYKTNTRSDSEYWRANAANTDLSPALKQLLSLWMAGKSIAPGVRKQSIGHGYPMFSWYAILAGVGLFPHPRDLRAPTAQQARHDLAEIDDMLARSVLNYPRHREALAGIPRRRQGPSLQTYFW
jgi:2-polyprenyl-6-methoxyphenol hydroxylase-like FAD-dependent oxidoreductase